MENKLNLSPDAVADFILNNSETLQDEYQKCFDEETTVIFKKLKKLSIDELKNMIEHKPFEYHTLSIKTARVEALIKADA